jgi:hypothetical protein
MKDLKVFKSSSGMVAKLSKAEVIADFYAWIKGSYSNLDTIYIYMDFTCSFS